VPTLVSGINLNTSTGEDYPLISADDLTLYFASSRAGGLGGSDIYIAKRTSVVAGFSDPVPFTEVNTAAAELPSWISADGCEFWFSRVTATSSYDFYVARRPL